jgi:hypothetical protein
MMRFVLLLAFASMGWAVDLRYWIEPCTKPDTGCLKDDPQLAEWALRAWEVSSGGALHLERAKQQGDAQIRIHWVDGNGGLYGEAQPIVIDGKRGANVYVLPQVVGPRSSDTLLRDAIVYLTCLHETGHALGLSHTADFADIMYSFQYGGDIDEYFGRYRRKLMVRSDIGRNAGMSPRDQERLKLLLKEERF